MAGVTDPLPIEAWLVIGEHHREVCLDAAAATQHAVQHHGEPFGLVRADAVIGLLKAAYSRGMDVGYGCGVNDARRTP